MVDFKLKIGDRLKMKAISIALGVPMGFLAKFWEYMNGKKTVVGAIITAIAVLGDQLGVLLPLFGVEAVLVGKIVGGVTLVLGVLHKIYKFVYKEEHK